MRYQQIEKVTLVLINTVRRLRHYFMAHTIIIRKEQPIKQLLGRPYMVGKMLKLSFELFQFDIKYESGKALKAQVLADIVAKMTSPIPPNMTCRWTIITVGASGSTGNNVGVILENKEGILIKVSLTLSFPTSNNQAE